MLQPAAPPDVDPEVLDPDLEFDESCLVTEDETPVDNPFSEREMKLLSDSLEASYRPGKPFLALTNVGLYFILPNQELVVPDFMLSLDVSLPPNIWEKRNRAYFVWRYGKPPELVVEIVSNKVGKEDTEKLEIYERGRVSYYVIHDPAGYLSRRPLRLFELKGTRYVELMDPLTPLTQLGLRLTLWDGDYAQRNERWLRWQDLEGNLLLTGVERAEQEQQRADQQQQRADQEQQRADQEQQRADRLAAKLRELGLEPD